MWVLRQLGEVMQAVHDSSIGGRSGGYIPKMKENVLLAKKRRRL